MTRNSPQTVDLAAASDMNLLVVISLCTAADGRAQELAQQLDVPHITCETAAAKKTPHNFDFELRVNEHLTLLQPKVYKSGPIGIDFNGGRNRHRLLHGGGRNQPLVRAVGIKRNFNRQQINAWHIIDTTSGFCRDSWALAAVGCRVTALERCCWLHQMQVEALQCAGQAEQTEQSDNATNALQSTAARITPVHTDATSWLQAHAVQALEEQFRKTATADVIYLDPMYPERKKSAAVKKEMQALHQLLGPDTDSDALLASACNAAQSLATKRIVVKRPGWAEALPGFAGWQVANSHSSENTRYDVYLRGTCV